MTQESRLVIAVDSRSAEDKPADLQKVLQALEVVGITESINAVDVGCAVHRQAPVWPAHATSAIAMNFSTLRIPTHGHNNSPLTWSLHCPGVRNLHCRLP